MNDAARFWSKVEKTEKCWLWRGGENKGYGKFFVLRDGRRKSVSAHRFAYELSVGPVPAGEVLLHECDTPLCVRPKHLKLGSRAEIVADSIKKGRHISSLWRQREHENFKKVRSFWDRLGK